jgi:hypothetical protein
VTRKAAYPSVLGLDIQADWLGGSYGISFWKKTSSPCSPFQITSYFWKCSTASPWAST